MVVYAALDAEFSEPILDRYEQHSDVRVLANFDVESTKTVGLTNRLLAERNRPRCDVFWNNEILNTMRLQREGVLQAYTPRQADGIPATFVSADGYWTGMAARARVILVNNRLVAEADRPTSYRDLTNPRWKGKCGLALPLFGTTATHAAVLFGKLGKEPAEAFFRDVKDNAKVLSGNKQVALEVAAGQLAWGFTDTDDAIIEIENGADVSIIFPDQGDGQVGALFIPNTLCILRDCPNPEEARRLVDYLLSPEIEEQLAKGSSAQFPLHRDAKSRSRAAPETEVRWMEVDFAAAAEQWDTAAEFIRSTFR